MMNRREAIASLALLAGGIWITKSCAPAAGEASIVLQNYSLSKADEELLAMLVRSIMPLDGTEPDDIKNLHLFVMKMVDDCHSAEEQKQFVDGLKSLKNGGWETKDLGKAKPFSDATEAERMALVGDLNRADDAVLKSFFEITKRRTIQGYTNSEYLMKGRGTYELIPGRYNGYAKV